jgi:hypothetical protein
LISLCIIDVEATLEEFKQKASNLDPNYIAESTGIPREILDTIVADEPLAIFLL